MGREVSEYVKEYFDSLPRAMFTVFRCSFGDCATRGGTPIFEYVTEHYGGFYAFLYAMYLFLMTIGLFNVISAIFVESIIAAAKHLNTLKLQSRLRDEKLTAHGIATIIKRCFMILNKHRH